MATINTPRNEQLRQRNKDSFQSAALYWNELANERLFEISKQLLGIGFIVLPLTGSVVLSDRILTPLNENMLVIGWLLLFISIISGFFNLWSEAKYFNYLSNDSSTREQIWSNPNLTVEEMDEKTNKLGQTESSSSFYPLIAQGLSLLLGVTFIMIVVYNLLLQDTPKPCHQKSRHISNSIFRKCNS